MVVWIFERSSDQPPSSKPELAKVISDDTPSFLPLCIGLLLTAASMTADSIGSKGPSWWHAHTERVESGLLEEPIMLILGCMRT